MDIRALPNQTVPLTQDGINNLLAQLNKDPAYGTLALKALSENPRRALYRLFELTAVQKSIIQNMSDSDLNRYIKSALGVKFGAAKAPMAKFAPDPIFSGDKTLRDNLSLLPTSCHCHIDIA